MMSPTRILLLGATGQVGSLLAQALPALGDVRAPTRAQLDLTDIDRVRVFLSASPPNVVVNAAAYAAVDTAEDEADLAFALNATLPRALAESCARSGALLVHYSTDYVFDGMQRTPYRETDPPNPINTYGVSKLAGEVAIADVGAPHLILRTSWVYGRTGRSLFSRVRQLKNGEQMRVVSDQIGAPTWSHRIATTTAAIVRQLLAGQHDAHDVSGIYHLAGSGETSRYDFARTLIALEHGEEVAARRILPVTTEEFSARARRPSYSTLDTGKVAAQFGCTMPHWRDDLALAVGRA